MTPSGHGADAATGTLPKKRRRWVFLALAITGVAGALAGALIASQSSWLPDRLESLLARASNSPSSVLRTLGQWRQRAVELVPYAGHHGGAVSAAFSPDGALLVTAGSDGELRVWDVESRSLVELYRGHDAQVNAIAVAPSGDRVATGDVAGNVRLWSREKGTSSRLWKHEAAVQGVAFVNDNELVSLASNDRIQRDLIGHDLQGMRSRDLAERLDASRYPEWTMVGGSRLLVLRGPPQGENTPNVAIVDLASMDAIYNFVDSGGRFDFGESVPWLAGETELVWSGTYDRWGEDNARVSGLDLSTGLLFEYSYCGAEYCSQSRFSVFAANAASRRVAYSTSREEWIAGLPARHEMEDGEFLAGGWRVGSVASFGELVRSYNSQLDLEPDNSYLSHDFSDLVGLEPLIADRGGIVALTTEGDTARRFAGTHASLLDVLRGRDWEDIDIQLDAVRDDAWGLEGDFANFMQIARDGEVVAELGSPQIADSYCGQNGCRGARFHQGLSSNALHVLATGDEGAGPWRYGRTALWLYHGAIDVKRAQAELAARGYLPSSIQGANSCADWRVVARNESYPAGLQANGWWIEGAWVPTAEYVSDYVEQERNLFELDLPAMDVPGVESPTAYPVFHTEDGTWSVRDGEDDIVVDVRKTRLGATREALLRLQWDKGLQRTGVLDGPTRRELGLPGRNEVPRSTALDGCWLRNWSLPEAVSGQFWENGIAFSPDGSGFVLASTDKVVHFDFSTGEVQEAAAPDDMIAVGFASRDEIVAVRKEGVASLSIATGDTVASPISGLASVEHVESYNSGAYVGLAGEDLSVLIERIDDTRNYREVLRAIMKDDEWIAVTPEGFFAASDGYPRERTYVRSGHRVMQLGQLSQALDRSDLIWERLRGDPESRFSEAARRSSGMLLTDGLPPAVRIVAPPPGHKATDSAVRVTVDLKDEGGGVGRVEWRVNGTVLGLGSRNRGLQRIQPAIVRDVSLVDGNNRIEVLAYNEAGSLASRPARVDVEHDGGPKGKPALVVLAAGISAYSDASLRLRFAARDAETLVRALESGKGALFSEFVDVGPLYWDDVTKASLEAAFARLTLSLRPQDVFVVFLAGHGLALDGDYYFLPADFRFHNEDSVRQSAVSRDDIQNWLSGIRARKGLVLLDTCNSGSFVEAQLSSASRSMAQKTAVGRLVRATGRATISASSADGIALEGVEGHGVFTYALLEGLAKADKLRGNNDGWVSTLELAGYVGDRVPELSMEKYGYEQIPQYNLHGTDFPISPSSGSPTPGGATD